MFSPRKPGRASKKPITMKTPVDFPRHFRQFSKVLLMVAFSQILALKGSAQSTEPLLEFSTGLVGQQVRLRWVAEPGARYRIEKSSDLSDGGWQEVALVETSTAQAVWVDPVKTTVKLFYRITRPQAEVFSLEPPVISVAGGEILIRGQLLPPGSFLVFEIDRKTFSFPLEPVAGQPGMWRASISGGVVAGIVIAARIVESNGTTICPVPQTIEITATGFATDAPPWLPPGAPVPQQLSNPIPGIGIVVKKNPGTIAPPDRVTGNPDQDCDDLAGGASIIAMWASRKGYEYYRAGSHMASAGSYNNPAYQSNQHEGTMPSRMKAEEKANRTKCANNLRTGGGMGTGKVSMSDLSVMRGAAADPHAINTKGTGGNRGIIGEVMLEFCPLSLDCPAGPQLACDLTYRSMVSSGSPSSFGPGWTCAYDISVVRQGAAHVKVFDGGGRADTYVLQPDGSYTCDGMFRSGRFDGETFTLTFADQGKWVFCPLEDSPRAGKISSIRDRNNVALTCDYDGSGLLSSVSSTFGQSLTFTRGGGGEVTRVTDHTGRYCDFNYTGGVLSTVSCPLVDGAPPLAGATTFTYTRGFPDPRRNNNLTACRDGAGRLLCAFTYADQTDPLAVDYDCVVSSRCSDSSVVPSATTTYTAVGGSLLVCDSDELGRLTETLCDRQHRPVQIRQYTGFCIAGDPVTSSSNRPTGKLRSTDPDFYQTTCSYNAQHCPVVVTDPDGLQTRSIYNWDLAKGKGLALQRGNLRVCTLRAPGGEERTISMTYLQGFGSTECGGTGSDIVAKGGMTTDVCRWDNSSSRQENIAGPGGLPKITPKISKESHGKSSMADGGAGGGGINYLSESAVAAYQSKKGWDNYQGRTYTQGRFSLETDGKMKEEGGRHTPFQNKFVSSLTTTLGQTFTNSFDGVGNAIACGTPISGAGCDMTYNALGQITSIVTLNGPGSSFTDEFTYDPASKFCSSVIRDPAGLHLTESCTRDALGRVTSVTDARGFDTLCSYDALDRCIAIQSAVVGGSRITTNCSYDAGGLLSRCDVEQRDATGALSATNPAYSSLCIRASATCPLAVSRFAVENRPVDLPAGADPSSVGIENFDVCDFTYDACGQLLETRTPAACLAQPVDQVCSYQYDERGLLYRGVSGGLGAVTSVTTQCDYTAACDLSRCATLGTSLAESPTSTYDYDSFRRCISSTDPMGNVETFSYDNQGYVTCSLFGELDDVVGSANNVLLARRKAKTGEVKGTIMKGFAGVASDGEPPIQALTLPGIGNACYELKVKNGDAFLDFFTEDETNTVERFTPGSAAPPVLETSVCDRSPAGLLQSMSTNGDTLLTCAYDSAARRYFCADGTCSISLTLDACDNVLSCARTDLSSVGGVPGKTFTNAFAYDALGRCIRVAEGGSITTCDFDSLGREIRRINPNGIEMFRDYDAGTQAAPYSVRTRCDVDGNGTLEILGSVYARSNIALASHRVSEAKPQAPRDTSNKQCVEKDTTVRLVTDSNGSTVTFTQDSQGRCVRTDFPDGTFEASAFDALGRLTRHTRKSGAIVSIDSDPNGRCLSSTVSPPADATIAPIQTVHRYDGLGNCVRTTQGASDIVCAFDSCCDLLSENQTGRVVSHTYNHRGRSSTTYPDGTRFTEVCDSQGRLISCALEGASGPPIVAFTYLGSRVASDTRLNGVVTTFTYRGDEDTPIQGSGDSSFDACVQSIVSSTASGVLSRDTFSRNRNQQLIRRETAFSSETSAIAPLRRQVYTLDRLDRVTRMQTGVRTVPGSATVTESDVRYTLDLEGKRLTATGGSNPGTYTSSSSIPPGDLQMKQYSTWPGGNLEWDANGCLVVHAHGTGGSFRYRYDALSRMVAVEDNGTGATLVSFGYDAWDRLVSRVIPGAPDVITTFVYDGEMCIQELGGDGLPEMTFAALGHCISTRNGTIYYPHGGGSSLATSPGGGMPHVKLITLGNGAPFERFDCDDACKPIFLTSEGVVRPGATRSLSLYNWVKDCYDRGSLWSSETGLFLHTGGTYSPDLGQDVSKTKPKETPKPREEFVGHVTLLK